MRPQSVVNLMWLWAGVALTIQGSQFANAPWPWRWGLLAAVVGVAMMAVSVWKEMTYTKRLIAEAEAKANANQPPRPRGEPLP